MKNPTIAASFRAALAGLLQSAAEGRNMRLHWLAGYTVLLAGHWLRLPSVEYLVLVLVVAQVLAAEMINTAVETVTDLATGAYHPLAKKAKDIAAGAVLVASLASLVVAVYIFVPRLGQAPAVLGERLAHPDAGLVLGAAGFAALFGYWAASLPPRRAGRAPGGGSRHAGHGDGVSAKMPSGGAGGGQPARGKSGKRGRKGRRSPSMGGGT